MAEGNGLENRRRETVPEFESLLLRHIMNDPKLKRLGVFRFMLSSKYTIRSRSPKGRDRTVCNLFSYLFLHQQLVSLRDQCNFSNNSRHNEAAFRSQHEEITTTIWYEMRPRGCSSAPDSLSVLHTQPSKRCEGTFNVWLASY